MWITRLSVGRPVLMWMALAALTVLGVFSYRRLPAELNPQVDIPSVTVFTVYPGASPSEVEQLVTRPIEEAVSGLEGVRDVYSSSQDSLSVISIDLRLGTNLDRAVALARERVEAIRGTLPPEVSTPVVSKLDINAQPILHLEVMASIPSHELRRLVDEVIAPRLSRLPGVGGVTALGGAREEVLVEVDPQALERHGITVTDVSNSISAAGGDVPAGSVSSAERRISVRSLGALRNLDELRSAQIVAPQMMASGLSLLPEGIAPARPSRPTAPLSVADVARVSRRPARPEVLNRVLGFENIGLLVTKAPDGNTVQAVQAVLAEIERLEEGPPRYVSFSVVRDHSEAVSGAIEDVNLTLVLGALLAMGVTFLFLRNLRGTFIVALALPACMVATYSAMHLAGFTLNQMTLLALSLSVGILIDDSIVVLESITRHFARGEEPAEAAINGRTEIGFASMTLTLADVVVFVPVAFMGGVVGAFFRQFGLTVVFATLFSLLVSFTITPSLAARWYRSRKGREAGHSEASEGRLAGAYRRALLLAIPNRTVALAGAATLLACAFLVFVPHVKFDFLPEADDGRLLITIEMPPDATLEVTSAFAEEVEAIVEGLGKEVFTYNMATTVGEILGGFGSIPRRGDHVAQVAVQLSPFRSMLAVRWDGGSGYSRQRSTDAIAEDLRARLGKLEGGRIVVSKVRTYGVGQPIQIQLSGPDLGALARAGDELKAILSRTPGVLDPDASYRGGKPELAFVPDRLAAAALGVPPALAGSALRDAIEGKVAGRMRLGETSLPVRVRLRDMEDPSADSLEALVVGTRGQNPVRLGELGRLERAAGPAAIDRVNGKRLVTVSANIAPGVSLGDAQAAIERSIPSFSGRGIETAWSGESAAMDENVPYFAGALGLAVALVYLLLAALFNSLLKPFVVLASLPMALAGALAALALTGESMSLVSMVGVMMLTGLMSRNAILLVDYASTLRSRGYAPVEAIVEASAARLRPILMTTLATVAGMLPVALRLGQASELRAPMAIVVIGGLLVSTVVTLFVVPLLLTLGPLAQRNR